jgi:hypothetical protein
VHVDDAQEADTQRSLRGKGSRDFEDDIAVGSDRIVKAWCVNDEEVGTANTGFESLGF